MSHGLAKLTACVLLGLLALAPAALADAPNPIPGTTKVDSYTVDAAGNRTVTVEGQWTWVTHKNCPTTRNGVGYQVAWFDGNTANPIGSSSSPDGVIYVGDGVDNIVHSLDNLDPANTDFAFNGVPASYLTHNLTNRQPNSTDLANWVSNCNNIDPTTLISSGTWGPISHTYPASYTAPIKLCPVVYDPHGSGTSTGGVIGSSSLKDIIAGGSGHQTDNSYEGNGTGVNGNNCLLVTIPLVTTKASPGVIAGGQIFDTATLSGGAAPTGTITFKLYKASDTTCTTQIGSSVSTNVTGNGNYPMPAITENTAGSYQWVATYSGDQNNLSSSSACNDPNEQVTVSPAVPGIAVVKTQQLNGAGGFTSTPVSGHPGDTVAYQMTVTNTGNDALTTVNFSDPHCDAGTLSGPSGGLAVGASELFTCSHVLTNADATAGSFTNTATASGVDAFNQTAGPVSSSVVANVTPTAKPGIAIVKQQRLNGSGAFTSSTLTGHPGDTLNYLVTVTNTGNTTLSTVSLSDPNCDSGTLAGSIDPLGGTLTAGSSATYTCSHLLNAADLAAGTFVNTARAVGTDVLGNTVGPVSSSVVANVTPKPAPGISIVKQQELNGAGGFTSSTITGHPGDAIDYKMTVTNTGNDTLTVSPGGFTDPKCDNGTLSGPASVTLAPGAQAVWTCSHTLTNGDLTAGSFTNTATVQAVDEFGTGVGPVSSSVVANVTPGPAPGISVVKVQQLNGTNAGGYTRTTLTGHPGDTVDYQMTVTNTGNDTLTVVNLNDPNCDSGTLNGPGGPLAVGAQAVYTCSHVLTAADLTAGSFTNTATAFGQDQFGTGVGPVSSSVTVNVTPAPAPSIDLVKQQQINGTSANGWTTSTLTGHPGDTVNYQMTVTNTGNDSLTLSFQDPKCDAGTLSGGAGSLASGAQAVWTCSHVLTAADLTAGSFRNTATVSGTDAGGTTVGPISKSVTVNVTPAPAPGIDLVKQQQINSTSANGWTTSTLTGHPGDTVNYQLTVSNTGNETLTLDLQDQPCDATPVGAIDASGGQLAAGAQAVFTCSHLLTNADLTAGSFKNTATVTGTDAGGTTVGPISKSVTVVVTPAPAPGIDLVKKQQLNGTSAGGFTTSTLTGHPGDTVNYEMTVSNTGNDALTLSFQDPKCDAGTLSGPSGSLAAGAQAVFTCSHVLTNSDLTAGSFTNTATVSGTDAGGTTVGPVSKSVTVNVTPAPAPGIDLLKQQQLNGTDANGWTTSTLTGHPGDTVNYQMTASNTGNEALTLTFDDPGCDSGTLNGPSGLTGGKLAAGAQAVWTCSHVLTAADLTAGSFKNTATVSGTDPAGTTVGPVSKSVVTNVTPAPAPGLTIVKSQRVNGTGSYTTARVTVQPGDTIDYAMLITNTGNVPLTLSFSDPICDAGTLSGPTGLTNGALAPGDSAAYGCTHLVTFADAAAGSVTNTASVTGTPPTGTPVGPKTATVTATVTVSPGMTVVKEQELAGSTTGFTTANITAAVGQEVVYRITVTNTGNEPLALAFTDPRCDAGSLVGPAGQLTSDGKLAVGGAVSYWCTHVITTADQTAGSLTNTVTVTGTPPVGPPVGPIPSSVTAQIPQGLVQGQCTLSLGKVKLTGANGSRRKAFTASVSSFGVKRVVFYLDGKKYSTARAAKAGKFSVRIDPRKLSYGAHHVKAAITFTNAVCGHTTRAGVFVHPKPAAVVPPFTG